MDLFTSNPLQNILPFDGEVLNYGLILNNKDCQFYLNTFLSADFWTQDELLMFGKRIKTTGNRSFVQHRTINATRPFEYFSMDI